MGEVDEEWAGEGRECESEWGTEEISIDKRCDVDILKLNE